VVDAKGSRLGSFFTGEVCALLSAFIWAVAVILFKKSGESVPPVALNLLKNVLVLVLLIPALLLVEGNLWPHPTSGEVIRFTISGALGFTVADTLFLMALNRLGAGLTAIVDCFYSPSMLGLAFLFLGERLPFLGLIGALLVVAAIACAVESVPVPDRSRRDVVIGITLGILGMVLVAASVVMVKGILSIDRLFWISAYRLAIGTVLLLPALLIARERKAILRAFRPSRAWRVAVPAALLGTGIAPLIWLAGMTLEKVSVNAVLNQLSTIFIFVLAALVLHEPVTKRRVMAVVLAFAGAMLVVIR
jgi:drug/metabolite transporter (DMT)-like permease